MKMTLLSQDEVAEDIRQRVRRGRAPRYVVRLTAEERVVLTALTHTGRSAARTLTHAVILLRADTSDAGSAWDDAQISAALGVSLSTIFRVRRAWVEQGLDAALERRASATPRPRKVDGAAEAHLVALACGTPPQGQARWTLRLLADRFAELEGGAAVSYETVRRTLKKTSSSPG